MEGSGKTKPDQVLNIWGAKRKKNCAQCYRNLRRTLSSKEARKRVKKTRPVRNRCNRSFCEHCFNESHNIVN
ncbi:unnamed protein product, partial [Iphiclides podalirius]